MARVNICLPEPRKVPYLKFLYARGGTPFEFFFLSTLGAIIGPPLVASGSGNGARAPIGLWLSEKPLRSPVPAGLLLSPFITQDLSTKLSIRIAQVLGRGLNNPYLNLF